MNSIRWTIAILLSVGMAYASQNPGAVFLMIWPDARPTSLAGAFAAIADDASCLYYNPAGLAFQRGPSAALMGCNWLPGLYPGMYYVHGAGCVGLKRHGTIGANVVYLTTGETDVINEQGQFLGRYTTFDVAPSVGYGFPVLPNLGVGFSAKFIYSYLVPDWVWKVMPGLGIERGGTGVTAAADIGALYKPLGNLNVGLSVSNLGPNISYASSGESDPLPRMLRVGLAYYPLQTAWARVGIAPEIQKVLVGMFYDSTKTFGQQLSAEVRDAWKSFGVEANILQLVTVRFGYFEDLTGARGGIVLQRGYEPPVHYGIIDVLTRRGLGRYKSLGLCWGISVGYKDYVRLDLATDHSIYDFSTTNRKLTLTCNNLFSMAEEVRRGQSFDWLR